MFFSHISLWESTLREEKNLKFLDKVEREQFN